MIKKILIAIAIICAPVMLKAADTASMTRMEAAQTIPMETFVKAFNDECPQDISEGMVLKSCDYRSGTNALVFNITVSHPEFTAEIFQTLAQDPQMRKDLASGFLTGNNDLQAMLRQHGCSVIFSFIFTNEGNKKVNMTITPEQIRNF